MPLIDEADRLAESEYNEDLTYILDRQIKLLKENNLRIFISDCLDKEELAFFLQL